MIEGPVPLGSSNSCVSTVDGTACDAFDRGPLLSIVWEKLQDPLAEPDGGP